MGIENVRWHLIPFSSQSVSNTHRRRQDVMCGATGCGPTELHAWIGPLWGFLVGGNMSLNAKSYKVYFWRTSSSPPAGLRFTDDRLSCEGHPWIERIKLLKGWVGQALHYHWTQHQSKGAEFPISVKSLLIKYPSLYAELNKNVV